MIGETWDVCVVEQEFGAPKGEGRFDKRRLCIHCIDGGHDGDWLKWKSGAEYGWGAVAFYRSTLCDGNVWMCDEHISEIAEERGIKKREVIHGALMNAAHPDDWAPHELNALDPYRRKAEFVVARADWNHDPDDPYFEDGEEAGEWLADNFQKDWEAQS